ncbi:hypothetical protein [Dolichospermum sp. UHCC 0406]|uniref:hypothetical protein n=1 Tax=Dolichospermum sp. UHCC 0406 TaxID=2590017 RepID=UPI001444D609|nr:hypothetical protein [Dolichospermum sp. UHCC 0406]
MKKKVTVAIAISSVLTIALAVRVNLAGVRAFLISIKSFVSGQLSVVSCHWSVVSSQELIKSPRLLT